MVLESRRTLSVLIPAYNEALNLEAAVLDVLKAATGFDDVEVVIVNDGSTDATAEVADRLAQELPQVVAIHHAHNRGFAAAYETALGHAHNTYFTFVPGDHEVAFKSVRDIFGAVGKADLVVPYHGTPWKRTWTRRALTLICTTQLNVAFGWRLHYYQGPVVYPTVLARALPRTTRGFFFLAEMLVHALAAGYSFTEIGLTHQERAYGRSKAVGLANIVQAQNAIVRLWWRVRVKRQRLVPQAPGDRSRNVWRGAQV
jgi:glycosyltransferase involved in cell wall biosynthesis